MRVLMDGQPLLGPRSGIARYTDALYRTLRNHYQLDATLSLNRIFKRPNMDPTLSWINHKYPYKVIRRLMKPGLLYNWPIDGWGRPTFDIYHGTNFTHLPMTHGKIVVTIHDLSFMHYPQHTSDVILKHHSRWVPYSAETSDHIIADSNQTKEDIISFLKVAEKKITVVPLAADEQYRILDVAKYAPVLTKYKLPDKYILFVGTIEPRKNLIQLVKAYNIVRTQISEKLVIVGAKGWKYSPLFQLTQDLKLEDDIIFTGFIEETDLPSIYNGASLLVMPSLYEGFGLPLLEAMGCGVPVIGSNVSSIPDIVGSAGVLVDPHQTEEISEAITYVLGRESVRNHYRELSIHRASQFSWNHTAGKTLDIYNSL